MSLSNNGTDNTEAVCSKYVDKSLDYVVEIVRIETSNLQKFEVGKYK